MSLFNDIKTDIDAEALLRSIIHHVDINALLQEKRFTITEQHARLHKIQMKNDDVCSKKEIYSILHCFGNDSGIKIIDLAYHFTVTINKHKDVVMITTCTIKNSSNNEKKLFYLNNNVVYDNYCYYKLLIV